MRRQRAILLQLACLLALGLGACGSFDNPTYVYDMRILGAIAEPPEILIPSDPDLIDPMNLPEVEVCALVADPGDSRELSFAMVACPPTRDGRCAAGDPQVDLVSGTVDDPEEADQAVEICGTLGPSPVLQEVIEASISLDSIAGFGAIDIQVSIQVWPAGNNLDQAIFGTKQVRFGVQEPAQRVANSNPSMDAIIVSRDPLGPRGLDFELPLGRCGDIPETIVALGEELQLLPVETEGTREEYVVPTFDGDFRTFTENIRYSFFSTQGRWTRGNSGGDRDISGKLPPLHTSFVAPDDPAVVGDGLDISLFIIQRDERGGQSWAQSCVRVQPD